MTQWQLRYRSPLSPTKGVDDVLIATKTDDEAEAKKLADWWLAKYMASPSTKFVFVRRHVVATPDGGCPAIGGSWAARNAPEPGDETEKTSKPEKTEKTEKAEKTENTGGGSSTGTGRVGA